VHDVEELAGAPGGVGAAQGDKLLGESRVGLGGGVVRTTGELVEAVLAAELEAADPLMGGLAGMEKRSARSATEWYPSRCS